MLSYSFQVSLTNSFICWSSRNFGLAALLKLFLPCQFSVVYKSEVIQNNLNPIWKPAKLKVRDLCNGDHNRALKIDIYDWDANSKHDLIGTVKTNLRDLRCESRSCD